MNLFFFSYQQLSQSDEKYSRRASVGLMGAAPINAAATNQNMTEVEESPETLQNIMRVTRDQESVFKVDH